LPHLSSEQMKKPASKFIKGEDLNIVIGSRFDGKENAKYRTKLAILKILNKKYGITEEDFTSAELTAVPTFKACDIGFDRSLIGAYGHDDRVCSYAAFRATVDLEEIPTKTVVTVLTDKEEIGSAGNTGLDSRYLEFFIADLAANDKMEARHVLSKSKCLSADVNAAYDPNFSSVYEINNSCKINHGTVMTKYTGTGGKSGSSDASAEFVG